MNCSFLFFFFFFFFFFLSIFNRLTALFVFIMDTLPFVNIKIISIPWDIVGRFRLHFVVDKIDSISVFVDNFHQFAIEDLGCWKKMGFTLHMYFSSPEEMLRWAILITLCSPSSVMRGQQLVWQHSRGYSFDPILMKLAQYVYPYEI